MAPYTDALCTTPACVHIASDILFGLAPNYTEIDPCTDFDQLVCGDWASHHGIPVGSEYVDSLGSMSTQIKDSARQILEGSYSSGPGSGWITVGLSEEQATADEENFAKISDAYHVCMNYTATAEYGLKPISAFVKKVVDALPTNSYNLDYAAALGKTITLFESYGIATTQRFAQFQNPYNPEETLLIILPLPADDFPSEEAAATKYLELVAPLISAVHPANITVKQATSRMLSVIQWRQTVNEALAVAAEIDAKTDTEDTAIALDALQKVAPLLNYKYVVEQLAPQDYEVDQVTVSNLGFFANFSGIIAQTPPEIMQTFFIWKAIAALSPYVESDQSEAFNTFRGKLSGRDVKSLAPRWQNCYGLVNDGVSWINSDKTAQALTGASGLTWILSRFFLNKHYSADAHAVTSQIVDNLEASFLKRIETRDWASEEVKMASAEKVRAITNLITWPTDPSVLDPILLNEYYADIEISKVHAVNALSFAKSRIAKRWNTLGKLPSKGEFMDSTLTINAFYSSPMNKIVLLAGVQQFPMYDPGFPSNILYGGMGSVVGHEITHGFDNNGRLFDATGNKTTWWDDASIEAFTNKTECFIKQYDEFTVTAPNGTQIHVSGEKTLGENIADAGGVATSFAAWKELEEKTGPTKGLPGLGAFTPEQLFFIKWGQSWCNIRPPAAALFQILNDDHSPGAARIKLVMENSEGFKTAFNCPTKEPVCELW